MKIQKNSPAHITVEHLSKISETGEVIFESVTGTIGEHSLTIVEGPSGCGKTTLLRIIAGLDTPTTGTVLINAKTATEKNTIIMSPYDRNIGMLFQDLALWPHMTGREQLEFVWKSRRGNTRGFETELEKYTTMIEFPKKLCSRYPHQLSRGQQQRLAIIRSIITNPSILLFDEPFTGLDKHLREMFVSCISDMQKTAPSTIVLVTHDLYQSLIQADTTITYTDHTFVFH